MIHLIDGRKVKKGKIIEIIKIEYFSDQLRLNAGPGSGDQYAREIGDRRGEKNCMGNSGYPNIWLLALAETSGQTFFNAYRQ